jgi:hypothetical protein
VRGLPGPQAREDVVQEAVRQVAQPVKDTAALVACGESMPGSRELWVTNRSRCSHV